MKIKLAILVFAVAITSQAAAPETLRELTEKVIEIEDRIMNEPYLKQYYDDLPATAARAGDCSSLKDEALRSRLVFVGDEHGDLGPIQLIESIAREHLRRGVKPALVIEFIFARYQARIDAYLKGRITLQQLRRQVKFDDFPWSWKWEQVSLLLELGRKEGLRVIAAEEGSNNDATRDPFTAQLLVRDMQANPAQVYLVMYGTLHLLGRNHIPDLLERRGYVSQMKIVNFLGRKTEAALIAAGSEKATCLRLHPNLVFWAGGKSALDHLREYHQELKNYDQEPRPEAAFAKP